MNPRDEAGLRVQRTDLVECAAVGTLVVLQDHLAHGLLFILINGIAELCEIILVVGKRSLQPLGNLGDIGLALLLVICEDSDLHLFGSHDLLHVLEHLLRNGYRLIGLFCPAALRDDLIIEVQDFLVDSIRLVDVIDHVLLRNFLRTCLDHADTVAGGGDGQLQVSEIPVLLGRVDDDLSVHKADLCRYDRPRKRNIGNGGGKRSTHHGNELRPALGIDTHDHALERDVVSHILGEQGTHGAVDDTACENRVLGSLSLSFVEAARHLADGVILLGILNGQREEIHAVPGLCGLRRSAQNRCVAVVHENAAVRLPADSSDIH